MKKYLLSTVVAASMASSAVAATSDSQLIKTLQEEIRLLKQKQEKSDAKMERLSDTLREVKIHDSMDNIKFSIDFRNTFEAIEYKYNKYSYGGTDYSGTTASNRSLMTQRLFLGMMSSPVPGLTFKGKFGVNKTWGGNNTAADKSLKEWSETSKPVDNEFKIREAYFVYSTSLLDGDLPFAFSVGRRPSADGFLANHREHNANPGSPLAHITNMEVDAAMIKLGLEAYTGLPSSYIKLVSGKAHDGVDQVYDSVSGYAPYAHEKSLGSEADEDVDFFVAVLNAYYDGQYHLMAQHATIYDTKGKNTTTNDIKVGAGQANLDAVSFQINGIGDMINDFLDDTKLFVSYATTRYTPESGYSLLGETEEKEGSSYWVGAVIPDMVTESGKLGVEYNAGSKYWTPMTWAEDTIIGSKVAVRGSAYEAYWNTQLFGLENLSSQVRYTKIQHDYTPNIRCSGWIAPEKVDIEAENLRLMIRYAY